MYFTFKATEESGDGSGPPGGRLGGRGQRRAREPGGGSGLVSSAGYQGEQNAVTSRVSRVPESQATRRRLR